MGNVMGFPMGLLGKGLPSAQMLSHVMGALYKKDIKDFDDFHCLILDIFNTINSSLPGNHYEAPSLEDAKKYFKKWNETADEEQKKQVFLELIKENVKPSETNDVVVFAGMVTPPAAMAAKRAGEKLPQVNIIKYVPDVIFVPALTLVSIFSSKLLSIKFKGMMVSE